MFYLAAVDLAHSVSNTVADGGIDINQIAQLSNGNPVMVLALGAIAAFGGKKGWDWLKQRQEQKHEEKLAAIEAQKTSVSGVGHEQCVAKQESLEAQVQVLRVKITEANQKLIDNEKAVKEIVEKQKQELVGLEEGVKKLKKKVKKIQEEIEEQEERERKNKKKRVKDSDDE